MQRSISQPGAWLAVLLLLSAPAAARRYPITKSDASGTWVGTPQGLLHGLGELWQRYGARDGLPADRIADVELSATSVWVATEAGLARLDKGSRRWEVFVAPALPANQVTSVSVDPSDADQIWVGTLGGLANYNVRTNSWTRLGEAHGLPSLRVNDVLYRGSTVWVATDRGLAAYDTKLRTFTVYTAKDGLAGEQVIEIDEEGVDLWLTGDRGLSRMSLQRRSFLPFRAQEGLPSPKIRDFVRVQNLIYIATDRGLVTYDTAADALAPFLHTKGLLGADVRGVGSAGGYVWFATSQGLARFEPTKKVWEYYRVEDGLSSEDQQQIAVAGNLLLAFGSKAELDTYDYKEDEWTERGALRASAAAASQPAKPASSAAAPASQPVAAPKPLKLTVSAELDTELKQDLRFPLPDGDMEREGYWLVNTLRLGAGGAWGGGRNLDFSGKLNWGDISPPYDDELSALRHFQTYELQLRYLGRPDDHVRELIGSTNLRLEPEGGRLTERTELEGGRGVIVAGPRRGPGGQDRFAVLQVAGGMRRGTPMRVVLRRPTVGDLQIKRFTLLKQRSDGSTAQVRYIIPSSVRATLDGRELERNVDYFIDHENGVLWLKNTDLMHALRVLEVEFEYEQIPRKNVGAVSMTDLLPRDGDIGQLKRGGQARWAKDEQGLFDEIDGGAEQYINRGWVKTLSQDYEWGSAGIILRIHDMETAKQADSIFLARKLPDAKPVPRMEGVFLEKQTASLTVKLVQDEFFVEISIDQASMEQEILSIAGWLVGKLSAKGSTSADALRDVVLTTSASLRFTDSTTFGLTYLGARSISDDAVEQAYEAKGTVQDLLALHALHTRKLGPKTKLDARVQTAASAAQEAGSDRLAGNGLLGDLLLTNPRLTLRAGARRYSENFAGIGVARETEFCRAVDGNCRRPGTSHLDHEISTEATVRGVPWLPVELSWQRQSSLLGRDYADAPLDRQRVGVRDVALGQISLERALIPKVTLGGGYVQRDDALADQGQVRASGSVESDLAEGLLKRLAFKKLYLRGLYEFGRNTVDEFRTRPVDERDRLETMHHAVAELRVAPTFTDSGYATLEYHGLEGVLDRDDRVSDLLTYWRLDTGAGSSVIPGLALRYDATLWFGDDQPLVKLDPADGSLTNDVQRKQDADSRHSGVIDLFPGEWVSRLAPLKFNLAYAYTEQGASQAVQRRSAFPLGREVCNNGVDDDGDGSADCQDQDCALDDACLVITSGLKSHRAYGTAYWDTPGKLQVEVFGDGRVSYSGRDEERRETRLELRSYVTWRPIYPSPLTLRFDVLRDEKRPETYDGIEPVVMPTTMTYEPALEWRRRWSVRWWHLAKVTVSHQRSRDIPHIRTLEDRYGRKGDLERLDYNSWSIKPSLEIRRRFEDAAGRWNVRPYVRASYNYQFGEGLRSRIGEQVCEAGEPCLADGSETSGLASLSLGAIWVHAEHVFVDLDLTTSYYDCRKAPTGSTCSDRVSFTPHVLTTLRY